MAGPSAVPIVFTPLEGTHRPLPPLSTALSQASGPLPKLLRLPRMQASKPCLSDKLLSSLIMTIANAL